MFTLSFCFFAVALLYATIGFGGGSSYIALLALMTTPYELIPKIGLLCNLLVVSGGCWLYYKKNLFSKRLILYFVLPSIPMSFFGGLYPIKEKAFMTLLALCLIAAALRLFFVRTKPGDAINDPPKKVAIPSGAALGFLSGLVGIGGGIFLSPLLLMCRWGRPKEVAATASLFIWLNSVAGLCGQMVKSPQSLVQMSDYFYLFIAVLIGGQIGSRIGTHSKVPQHWIQNATAILILFIGSQLLLKVAFKL